MARVRWLRLCVARISVDVQLREGELSEALCAAWTPFATAFAQERLRVEVKVEPSLRPGESLAQVPYPTAEPLEGGGWSLVGPGFTATLSQDYSEASLWLAEGERTAVDTVVRLMLAQRLVAAGGALLHAVGVELEGRAAVFPGASGAGKSTLAALVVRGGGRILGDELVALRPEGGRLESYGTPWHVGTPQPAPLALLGTLVHAPHHRLEPLAPSGLARTFLENTVLARPEHRIEALKNLESWVPSVKIAELHFARDTGVAAALREALLRAPR